MASSYTPGNRLTQRELGTRDKVYYRERRRRLGLREDPTHVTFSNYPLPTETIFALAVEDAKPEVISTWMTDYDFKVKDVNACRSPHQQIYDMITVWTLMPEELSEELANNRNINFLQWLFDTDEWWRLISDSTFTYDELPTSFVERPAPPREFARLGWLEGVKLWLDRAGDDRVGSYRLDPYNFGGLADDIEVAAKFSHIAMLKLLLASLTDNQLQRISSSLVRPSFVRSVFGSEPTDELRKLIDDETDRRSI